MKSVNEDGSLTFDYDYEFTNPNGVAFDMMGVNTFFAWSWDDPHVAGDPVGTTMQGYIDAMVLAGE